MGSPPVHQMSLDDVRQARSRIEGVVSRTPLVHSPELSRIHGGTVYLKLENLQLTGSFKLRGALNAVLAMTESERGRGVVTVSTGNHGRAVAFACRRSGVRAVVCVSRLVPGNKLAAIEELGAEVRIVGSSQDEAQLEAERLVAEEGLTLVPPFDHPEVIAGQGTLGLEIAEQLVEQCGPAKQAGEQAPTGAPPRVLVPLSGGGLVAGVALALKSAAVTTGQPAPRVTAVSMERGCAMFQSLQAGEPVEVEEQESLADSLGGGIGLLNRYTFNMVRDLVDEHLLVSEELVGRAIAHAYQCEGQVVEGAGAVGIAALLAEGSSDRERATADSTVVLVSGGNIDSEVHGSLLARASGAADHAGNYAANVGAKKNGDANDGASESAEDGTGSGVRSTAVAGDRMGGE